MPDTDSADALQALTFRQRRLEFIALTASDALKVLLSRTDLDPLDPDLASIAIAQARRLADELQPLLDVPPLTH